MGSIPTSASGISYCMCAVKELFHAVLLPDTPGRIFVHSFLIDGRYTLFDSFQVY